MDGEGESEDCTLNQKRSKESLIEKEADQERPTHEDNVFENSKDSIIEDMSALNLNEMPNRNNVEVDEVKDKLQEQCRFQQVEVQKWELPSFKGNLRNYLDNEYRDGEEICPIRSSLIQNGGDINAPCSFLLHFFVNHMDLNQNFMHKTSSEMGLISDSSNASPDSLFLDMQMTLVECPDWVTTGIYANYRVSISSEFHGFIGSFGSKISSRSLSVPETVSYVLNWDEIQQKLDPHETIIVEIQHTTYACPSIWGLDSQNEVEMMKSFMLSGSMKWDKDTKRILKKCKELKLFGIIECYDEYYVKNQFKH